MGFFNRRGHKTGFANGTTLLSPSKGGDGSWGCFGMLFSLTFCLCDYTFRHAGGISCKADEKIQNFRKVYENAAKTADFAGDPTV